MPKYGSTADFYAQNPGSDPGFEVVGGKATRPGGYGQIDWNSYGGMLSPGGVQAAANDAFVQPNVQGGTHLNRNYGSDANLSKLNTQDSYAKYGYSHPGYKSGGGGMMQSMLGTDNTPGSPPPAGGLDTMGIDVGPVHSPQVTQYHENALRSRTAPSPQGVSGQLSTQLGDLMSGNMNRAATDFVTQSAYNNAQQDLRSQLGADQAQRGRFGVDAAEYLSNLGNQTSVYNMLLASMGSLLPPPQSPSAGLPSLG